MRCTAAGVLLWSLLLPAWARPQAQGKLEIFQGGLISANLKIASTGVNGFTGYFPGIGGGFSQLTPGPESVRWNPVGLAFIEKSQLYSEWIPALHINPTFLNLESTLNDQLRTALEPFMEANDPGFRDAQLRHELGLDGGQGSYAVVLKTRRFTLGGAVYGNTRFKLNLGFSGVKMRAMTESGSGGTTIRLLGFLNGTLDADFDLTGLSLAFGKKLGHGFAVGLGFDSFSASFKINSFVQPQAQVSSGAEEYAFNDPKARHYNRLQGSAHGTLTGEGGKVRLGLAYHPSPKLAIDLAIFPPADLDFNGKLAIAYDQIRAFDFDLENDRPFFDANILLKDQFTGTHPRTIDVDGVSLQLPGRLAIAFGLIPGALHLQAVYVEYWKPAQLSFRYHTGGDSTAVFTSGSGRFSFGPERVIFAAFGASWLQVRLGAFKIAARSEVKRLGEGSALSTWGPVLGFSGGFALPYFKRLRLDYDLSAGLTTFLRFATTYSF